MIFVVEIRLHDPEYPDCDPRAVVNECASAVGEHIQRAIRDWCTERPMALKKRSSSRHRLPGKRVSEEEAEVQYRYGSLRISRDDRVRFSARTFLGLPELDFSVRYGAGLPDGGYIWTRSDYSITANLLEQSSFLFLYLTRGRIESACFNFGLTPEEMRKAVSVLRKAANGLERWIVPALEHTRNSIVQMTASPGFRAANSQSGAEMLDIIEELMAATRDLPVAKRWEKAHRTSSHRLRGIRRPAISPT